MQKMSGCVDLSIPSRKRFVRPKKMLRISGKHLLEYKKIYPAS
jgi:hypothetical protein